jgi:hypothetical protein
MFLKIREFRRGNREFSQRERHGRYTPETADGTTAPCVRAHLEHSGDRDQSFQRIATSVTRVRDGTVGCCF